jgi:hypothetical protein
MRYTQELRDSELPMGNCGFCFLGRNRRQGQHLLPVAFALTLMLLGTSCVVARPDAESNISIGLGSNSITGEAGCQDNGSLVKLSVKATESKNTYASVTSWYGLSLSDLKVAPFWSAKMAPF